MKKIRLQHLLVTGILLFVFYSCSKDSDRSEPQGGLLPTNYININDGSFSPTPLTVSAGSSFTFLNKTTGTHTIVSADSSTLLSKALAPDSFYYVKPDTLSGSQPVVIYYHCKEHPTVTGTIILTP